MILSKLGDSAGRDSTGGSIRNANSKQAQVGAHIVDVSSEGRIQDVSLAMPDISRLKEGDVIAALVQQAATTVDSSSMQKSADNTDSDVIVVQSPQTSPASQAGDVVKTQQPIAAQTQQPPGVTSMPQTVVGSPSSEGTAWTTVVIVLALLILIVVGYMLHIALDLARRFLKAAPPNQAQTNGRKPEKKASSKFSHAPSSKFGNAPTSKFSQLPSIK